MNVRLRHFLSYMTTFPKPALNAVREKLHLAFIVT